jgi:hypothetical protein
MSDKTEPSLEQIAWNNARELTRFAEDNCVQAIDAVGKSLNVITELPKRSQREVNAVVHVIEAFNEMQKRYKEERAAQANLVIVQQLTIDNDQSRSLGFLAGLNAATKIIAETQTEILDINRETHAELMRLMEAQKQRLEQGEYVEADMQKRIDAMHQEWDMRNAVSSTLSGVFEKVHAKAKKARDKLMSDEEEES